MTLVSSGILNWSSDVNGVDRNITREIYGVENTADTGFPKSAQQVATDLGWSLPIKGTDFYGLSITKGSLYTSNNTTTPYYMYFNILGLITLAASEGVTLKGSTTGILNSYIYTNSSHTTKATSSDNIKVYYYKRLIGASTWSFDGIKNPYNADLLILDDLNTYDFWLPIYNV